MRVTESPEVKNRSGSSPRNRLFSLSKSDRNAYAPKRTQPLCRICHREKDPNTAILSPTDGAATSANVIQRSLPLFLKCTAYYITFAAGWEYLLQTFLTFFESAHRLDITLSYVILLRKRGVGSL